MHQSDSMPDTSLSNHLTAFSQYPARLWRCWRYLLVLPTASQAFSTHKLYMQMCRRCNVGVTFLAFLAVFPKKIYTAFSIFCPNRKDHEEKSPFWHHASTKQQQLSTCPSVLAAFRHTQAERCNVGVAFLAFFWQFYKKTHTILSIFRRSHSEERVSEGP